jgi:hypothetical protein
VLDGLLLVVVVQAAVDAGAELVVALQPVAEVGTVASSRSASGTRAGSKTTRSRTSTGAVRWLIPTTTRDI